MLSLLKSSLATKDKYSEFPVIEYETAIDDLNSWLNLERKGWTKAFHGRSPYTKRGSPLLHTNLTKDDASTRARYSSVEMSQERVDTDTQCSSLTPSSSDNPITTRTKEFVVATRHQVTSIIRSTRSEWWWPRWWDICTWWYGQSQWSTESSSPDSVS